MTPESTARDLDTARALARAGIPIFLAPAATDDKGQWRPDGGHGGCGYWLPRQWEQTKPDPAVLDAWRPGMAVCAVMGHGLDALDIDPRNGGDGTRAKAVLAGVWPRTYAKAETPSGGTHELVNALDVRSLDGVRPGLDVKAGRLGADDNGGHGFIFIAPTQKLSKTTGELAAYRWTERPDLELWAEERDSDDTGEALAEAIRAKRGTSTGGEPEAYDGPSFAEMPQAQQDQITRWTDGAVSKVCEELRASASWPTGHRDASERGWERFQADAAWRLGRLARASWNGLTMAAAEAAFLSAAPTDAGWTRADVKDKWDSQKNRKGPAPYPEKLAAEEAFVNSLPAPTVLAAASDLANARSDAEHTATEAELDAAAAFAREVSLEAYRLRVREAARATVDAEKAAAVEVPPFDAGLLSEVLARPDEPPHRAEGLIPSDAGTLIVAQRKTGKTTLQLNLARSLILGGDFLGRFPVRPVTGRVGFLNFEVSAAQLARWAAEVGVPEDRLYLVNLRGRRNPFTLDADREQLAEQLRAQEVETLIVDPFGRAYTGKSQNDPGEVGAWLSELDRFARGDCGVSDVVLAAHAGWDGERTRGSSALEDWADVIVTLVRDRDDDQERYLRAEGRDVLVDEDRLDFDGSTRTLTLAGAGSRKAAAKTRHLELLLPAVVELVKASPGITGYKIGQALRDAGHSFQKGDESKAAALAVDRGILDCETGSRNSRRYFPARTASPPRPPQTSPAGNSDDLPDLPYKGEVVSGEVNGSHLPAVDLDSIRGPLCPECNTGLGAHGSGCSRKESA